MPAGNNQILHLQCHYTTFFQSQEVPAFTPNLSKTLDHREAFLNLETSFNASVYFFNVGFVFITIFHFVLTLYSPFPPLRLLLLRGTDGRLIVTLYFKSSICSRESFHITKLISS